MVRDENECVCGHPYIVHPAGDGCCACDECERFVPRKKRSKFNAKRTTVRGGGETFDSRGEHDRYAELLWMEKSGVIYDLERQVKFELSVNGVVLGIYKADHVYRLVATGQRVVEDFKGFATPLYQWKKKHMAAQYGVQIQEVGSRCRKSRSPQSSRMSAKASSSLTSTKLSRGPSKPRAKPTRSLPSR